MGIRSRSPAETTILLMPIALFPLSFITLRAVFIEAMAASTIVMGSAALSIMAGRGVLRGIMVRGGSLGLATSSALASALLYLAFLGGGLLSRELGMWGYVEAVYSSIRGSALSQGVLLLVLAVIGSMEEIFWRGYVQGWIFEQGLGMGARSVILSSLYYTAAHIPTANPPLVAAAFIVGAVLGYTAQRFGVISSAAAHIAWLELVVVYIPVDSFI